MSKQKSGGSVIALNKKARHYYELLDSYEAGIALTGPEVKSMRAGQVNFRDSYVEFRNGEAFVVGLHMAPYSNAGYVEQDPDRTRKLLLNRYEIEAMAVKVEQKGLTIVPTKLYFKNGRIKLEVAVGRGKKLHDQREDLKRRAEDRDTQRELARF